MEYDGGGSYTAPATHRYADKARGIVGLAVQMRYELGVEMDALRRLCIWADVRSLFRTSQSKDRTHAESVRIRLYKLHEPIKFCKFPICLKSRRLRFIIARTAKFLPHE